jgi:hypothetical protein
MKLPIPMCEAFVGEHLRADVLQKRPGVVPAAGRRQIAVVPAPTFYWQLLCSFHFSS